MKRVFQWGLGIALAAVIAVSSMACDPIPVLYAQSLPSVRIVGWSPNAASDNVIAYKLQLDGGPVIRVSPAVCSGAPIECTSQISVPTYGNHVVSIKATNLALSTVPTSEQDSPALSLPFTLNQVAGTVSNGVIR